MSTIKLNDTQLVVLTAAAKAAAPIGVDALTTLKAKGGARARAVNGLLKRRLLEEVAVKPTRTYSRCHFAMSGRRGSSSKNRAFAPARS